MSLPGADERMQMICDHVQLESSVSIAEVVDDDDQPVGRMAHVTIRCSTCHVPFAFHRKSARTVNPQKPTGMSVEIAPELMGMRRDQPAVVGHA